MALFFFPCLASSSNATDTAKSLSNNEEFFSLSEDRATSSSEVPLRLNKPRLGFFFFGGLIRIKK